MVGVRPVVAHGSHSGVEVGEQAGRLAASGVRWQHVLGNCSGQHRLGEHRAGSSAQLGWLDHQPAICRAAQLLGEPGGDVGLIGLFESVADTDTHLAEVTEARHAYRYHFGPANVAVWSLANRR